MQVLLWSMLTWENQERFHARLKEQHNSYRNSCYSTCSCSWNKIGPPIALLTKRVLESQRNCFLLPSSSQVLRMQHHIKQESPRPSSLEQEIYRRTKNHLGRLTDGFRTNYSLIQISTSPTIRFVGRHNPDSTNTTEKRSDAQTRPLKAKPKSWRLTNPRVILLL